ncbi:MAG: helix-turn-helix transcriptional regulator [Rhodobacteraceae bacterium]|nr:helix-turn-helix transcriptional regulator [Paracoccaceae bacterium]
MKVNAKDKATGRFKSRVNGALVEAVAKAKRDRNLTQSQIADQMGIEESTLSRILNGQRNLTLKTIGDACWVLGMCPDIIFTEAQQECLDRADHPAVRTDMRRQTDEPPRSTECNFPNGLH